MSIHDNNLVINYSKKMAERANDFVKDGKFVEAIELYKNALLLPAGINEANINFNLAIAYKNSGDSINEMQVLKKVIELNVNNWAAYEELGGLYLSMNDLNNSRLMFRDALKSNSPNRSMIQQYLSMLDAIQRKSN